MSKEIAKIDYEDIKKLEKVKQLLIDIKEIDNEFKISNIININDNSTLIFKSNSMLKIKSVEEIEERISRKLDCKCIILDPIFDFVTAIKKEEMHTDKEINYNKRSKIDYTVETYFADNKPYKEVRKYYKYPPIVKNN